MSEALEFIAYGTPMPKGSMRSFLLRTKGGAMRAGMKHDNEEKILPWMVVVQEAAFKARGARPPLEVAVRLSCVFYLPRPKSLKKAVTRPQTKRADLDKLLRAVKDALTRAGVYRDDCQVCEYGQMAKVFAAGVQDLDGAGGVPRVAVRVEELT